MVWARRNAPRPRVAVTLRPPIDVSGPSSALHTTKSYQFENSGRGRPKSSTTIPNSNGARPSYAIAATTCRFPSCARGIAGEERIARHNMDARQHSASISGTTWRKMDACWHGIRWAELLRTTNLATSQSRSSHGAGATFALASQRYPGRIERRGTRAFFAAANVRNRLLGRAHVFEAAGPGVRRSRRA